MTTLVAFHAHPDDEVLTTGGTLAKAAEAGHRVVLVVATRGELGESPDDLRPGESLTERRSTELERSAAVLGVSSLRYLDYLDSGMAGDAANERPGAFCSADLDEAATRLAAILDEESADVLTVYDEHGNYDHPDHIQVHRVGHRAASLARRRPVVFEATVNRDALVALWARHRDDVPMRDTGETPEQLGMPESAITTRIDVDAFVDRKREAFRCHASQTSDTAFFLEFPDAVFRAAFGVEWFIRVGARRAPDAPFETDLFT